MYTSPATSAPVGPHPFLCQNCERGTAGPVCECGWTGCNCETCRQALRKERNAPSEFMHDVVRGFLVIGCAGGSRPPKEPPAPAAEAPSAEPTPPAAPPVPPAKTATSASFRSMIRLCGLSHAEAAVELGQSESAIKKKSSGSLASTEADMLHLVVVWQRIRRGDLEKLKPGSREAAAALRELEE